MPCAGSTLTKHCMPCAGSTLTKHCVPCAGSTLTKHCVPCAGSTLTEEEGDGAADSAVSGKPRCGRRQSGRGKTTSNVAARSASKSPADGASLSATPSRSALFKVIDIDDGEPVDSKL